MSLVPLSCEAWFPQEEHRVIARLIRFETLQSPFSLANNRCRLLILVYVFEFLWSEPRKFVQMSTGANFLIFPLHPAVSTLHWVWRKVQLLAVSPGLLQANLSAGGHFQNFG